MHKDFAEDDSIIEIQTAQADTILSTLFLTVVLNVSVALFAATVCFSADGSTPALIAWLAASLAVLALRYRSGRSLRAAIVAGRPATALRGLACGALASGLCLAALPLVIGHFDVAGPHALILLIMVGAAAGAVARGFPYSPVALGYAVPPLASILLVLMAAHTTTAAVLAINIFGIMLVLYSSSRSAQATFVDNERSKCRASRLASSLQQANSDIRLSNSRLQILASCDPLTGLANRVQFNSELKADIALADDDRHELALLVIDLDRFKSINDTLGHSAGDAVLVEIAHHLRQIVGHAGKLARLGGDEFAVTFRGGDAGRRARLAAHAILKKARAPVTIAGGTFVIGTSIGLAVYPQHAGSAETLLASADMALYEAKEQGRRRLQEFNPRLKSQADRQRQIELDLEPAIADGAVTAWFQPQVMLADARVVGFEALVRWTHPQLGPISPPEIVLAAQAMHLSDRLTASMAAAACRLLHRLPGLGLPEATVAINVSPREFTAYSVADVLAAVVADHGINPALLEVEITEEAIVDTTLVGGELKRLEEAGYKLAVDDFGMGHSSLAYLISLKIDRLKIDRSFVEGVADSRHNQALVAALVGIGHSLSIDIVVEGVEREADAIVLRTLGCRIGQGYLYARPMAVDALMPWIERHRSPPRVVRRPRAVAVA